MGKICPGCRATGKNETLPEERSKKGLVVRPIEIEGRKIATSFWGRAWCDHLESYADFYNRLARGRTYARNGSVGHLEIQPGAVNSYVVGSELYRVNITITKIASDRWNAIKTRCSGQIGSAIELCRAGCRTR